jgi:hypothetical protein
MWITLVALELVGRGLSGTLVTPPETPFVNFYFYEGDVVPRVIYVTPFGENLEDNSDVGNRLLKYLLDFGEDLPSQSLPTYIKRVRAGPPVKWERVGRAPGEQELDLFEAVEWNLFNPENGYLKAISIYPGSPTFNLDVRFRGLSTAIKVKYEGKVEGGRFVAITREAELPPASTELPVDERGRFRAAELGFLSSFEKYFPFIFKDVRVAFNSLITGLRLSRESFELLVQILTGFDNTKMKRQGDVLLVPRNWFEWYEGKMVLTFSGFQPDSVARSFHLPLKDMFNRLGYIDLGVDGSLSDNEIMVGSVFWTGCGAECRVIFSATGTGLSLVGASFFEPPESFRPNQKREDDGSISIIRRPRSGIAIASAIFTVIVATSLLAWIWSRERN